MGFVYHLIFSIDFHDVLIYPLVHSKSDKVVFLVFKIEN